MANDEATNSRPSQDPDLDEKTLMPEARTVAAKRVIAWQIEWLMK